MTPQADHPRTQIDHLTRRILALRLHHRLHVLDFALRVLHAVDELVHAAREVLKVRLRVEQQHAHGGARLVQRRARRRLHRAGYSGGRWSQRAVIADEVGP